jgi:hypothetical protein
MNHIVASLPTDTTRAAMERARQAFLREWRRFVAAAAADEVDEEMQATGRAMRGILQVKPRA